MKLMELPIGKASSIYKLKIPENATIVGVCLAHRDDTPALLVEVPSEHGEMVEKEFAVIGTADQLVGESEQRLIDGPKRFIGTVSDPNTPSWAIYYLPVPDQDMRS